MAKEALKARVIEEKGNNCEISGEELPEDTSLFDTHRYIPKRKNGNYTLENTGVVIPIHHMKEHGTYREREESIEKLKSLVDERNRLIKSKNAVENQIRAYKRGTDNPTEEILKHWENQSTESKKMVSKWERKINKDLENIKIPIVESMRSVKGIGTITIAYCLVYLDPNKARHASAFWKYCGLHAASYNRYVKNEASGGNKTLRCVLWNTAVAQMKVNGAYRYIYDRQKKKRENSDQITKSRNTQGHLIECAWKDTKPSHRHGDALRAVMKHFLADLWYVWRTIEGLPTTALYPEAHLGSTHRTILPEERGWIY
jgi:hypothetical protein